MGLNNSLIVYLYIHITYRDISVSFINIDTNGILFAEGKHLFYLFLFTILLLFVLNFNLNKSSIAIFVRVSSLLATPPSLKAMYVVAALL